MTSSQFKNDNYIQVMYKKAKDLLLTIYMKVENKKD